MVSNGAILWMLFISISFKTKKKIKIRASDVNSPVDVNLI